MKFANSKPLMIVEILSKVDDQTTRKQSETGQHNANQSIPLVMTLTVIIK